MAVITKLFTSRQKSKDCSGFKSYVPLFEPFQGWEQPAFNKDQLRLLLLQHEDHKDHTTLLDSKYCPYPFCDLKSHQKTNTNKKCSSTSAAKKKFTSKGTNVEKKGDILHNGPKRLDIDVKLIGEMVFGTLDMAKQGSGVKVHTLKSPLTLMVSEAVTLNLMPREAASETNSLIGSVNMSRSGTLPVSNIAQIGLAEQDASSAMDVPHVTPTHRDMDSGVCGSLTSSGSFVGACGASSPGSSSCLLAHRRLHYYTRTSLESTGSFEDSFSEGLPPRRQRRRLCLVLLFGLGEDGEAAEDTKLERFIFSHFTLIQRHLSNLRQCVELAYRTGPGQLHHPVMKAFERFRQAIYDLYTAPRLSSPVWLSMMAYSESHFRQTLCSQFVQKMMALTESADTKSTNL